jgi:chemotaxis protein methyltransferase CheR
VLEISQNDLQELTRIIRQQFGINLEAKPKLVEGRLSHYIQEAGFQSLGDYLNYVFQDTTGQEWPRLIERLTTNHTYFFREPAHFKFLSQKILPELEKTVRNHDIRIWSAGCSSGEEPYSIAMVLAHHFGLFGNLWDKQILATDISARVLETARAGRYPASALEEMPIPYKTSYFRKVGQNTYEVVPTIRQEVIFRSLNLAHDAFPLRSRFHVILCRNVMIYFDSRTKSELVERFYDWTEPGGYLLIGHTETISRKDTRWQYIQPAVYRKPW